MVDLHSHILPGVDDGSPDLAHSLELAKEAVNDGVTHMLLTPHHMDGQYINHKKDVVEKTKVFQNALNNAEIPLKVFPCQEVHLTDELLKAIEQDDILFADEEEHYLMLELPHTHVPEYFFKNILPELKSIEITPIIVHPERNQEIQRNHELLYELVDSGCLTQLTASSYLNVFGESVTQLTQEIIDSNLGTTFSSDAHNLTGRRTRMQDAYSKLNTIDNFKAELYLNNGRAILNGEVIEMSDIHRIRENKKKKKFWKFWK